LLTIVIAGLRLGDGALTVGRNLRQVALQPARPQVALAGICEAGRLR